MADKQSQFSDDRPGWAKRWGAELKAAKEALDGWHKSAEECLKEYLSDSDDDGNSRLCLFTSNINTQESVLYGQTPKVDVTRRYNDAEDHDGRIAATLLDRMLNGDIERDDETYPRALGNVLSDWLKVGFGNYRFRYVRTTEPVEAIPPKLDDEGKEQAPAVPATEKVTSEEVETEYSYWKHQLWSPAHVFADVRWWGFKVLISQDTAEEKFGERLPLKVASGGEKGSDETEPSTPWDRAEVWEIWDKEHKGVWWYCPDHPSVLVPKGTQAEKNGMLKDPLGLRGFWPFPEPLFSNLTTSKLVPRPDYAFAQDLYKSIDESTTRIDLLRGVVNAAGVFDKTVGELENLLKSRQPVMLPAKNYAALSEKGGIANCVAWLPIEAFVAALDKLRELRNEDMQMLVQVTGMSDIIRGQAMSAGATATEQSIKAKFASVRIEKAQKAFSRFASDGQRIRGEIIAKHFQPETIMLRANVAGLPQVDQQRVPQAVQLLKSDVSRFRVVVKPEAISLTDYAANKQESMDVLGTIGAFMQSVAPLAQMAPAMAPMLLQLLQTFISRTKGGEATEGILDQAIEMAKRMAAQPPPPPQPDPTQQIKAQAEMGKAQAGIQKTQLDMVRDVTKHSMEMSKLKAEQVASAQEHSQGIQSQEAQARAEILKQVANVTGGGQA